MDMATAAEAALRHVTQECGPLPDDEWAVHPVGVRCRLGWVFGYNTRSYLESGDIDRALFGPGPVLVRDDSGRGWSFPSAFGVEQVASMIDAHDSELAEWLPDDGR
jgi:hypothetical protein